MLCRCVCEKERSMQESVQGRCLPGTGSRFKTVWGWQTQQDLSNLNKPGKILAILIKPNWPPLTPGFTLCTLVRSKFFTLTSLLRWRHVLWHWKFSAVATAHLVSLAAQSGHNLAAYPQQLKIHYVCCRKIKSGSKQFIDLLTAPD